MNEAEILSLQGFLLMNVDILQSDMEDQSTNQYPWIFPPGKNNSRISRLNTLKSSHLYVVSSGTLSWKPLVPLVTHNLKVLPTDLQCVKKVRIWSYSGPNASKYGSE